MDPAIFDARTLNGIGVLAAVAEAGSFSRAGELLGLTPSGVSRAVARLEARVGVRLFDRTSRAVSLTEEGRRFLARIDPILSSLDDATAELSGSAEEPRGRLRVNVDPWFSRMMLAPALPGFLAAHPRLELELAVSNHREEMMVGADVAIRFGPAEGQALVTRKLGETPVITCAAPAYLRERGMPMAPEDLAGHDLILFRDPQTGRPFEWEYERRGSALIAVAPKGRLTTDDPSTAVEACVAGGGVFQSLAMGLEQWLESGRLVRILTDWSDESFPLHAYHPSRHLPAAKVRAFIDFAQALATTRGEQKPPAS